MLERAAAAAAKMRARRGKTRRTGADELQETGRVALALDTDNVSGQGEGDKQALIGHAVSGVTEGTDFDDLFRLRRLLRHAMLRYTSISSQIGPWGAGCNATRL